MTTAVFLADKADQAANAGLPELTEVEARALTDDIKGRVSDLLPRIREAYYRRADKALNYGSWHMYCLHELGGLQLPVSERPAAVAELRESGMSQRAIGAALGVDQATVSRDLRATDAPCISPERVMSLDGRERPATQPARPEAAAGPEPLAETSADSWRCSTCAHIWPHVPHDSNLCPGCGGRAEFLSTWQRRQAVENAAPRVLASGTAADRLENCEACGKPLPYEEATAGYRRCDGCDDQGDHVTVDGACVACSRGAATNPEPIAEDPRTAQVREIHEANAKMRADLEAIPAETIAALEAQVRPAVQFAQLASACQLFAEQLADIDAEAARDGFDPAKASPIHKAFALLDQFRSFTEAMA